MQPLFGPEVPLEQVVSLIFRYDSDCTGFVDFGDFLTLVQDVMLEHSRQVHELKQALHSLAGRKELLDAHDLRAVLMSPSDSGLTYAEFAAVLKVAFPLEGGGGNVFVDEPGGKSPEHLVRLLNQGFHPVMLPFLERQAHLARPRLPILPSSSPIAASFADYPGLASLLKQAEIPVSQEYASIHVRIFEALDVDAMARVRPLPSGNGIEYEALSLYVVIRVEDGSVDPRKRKRTDTTNTSIPNASGGGDVGDSADPNAGDQGGDGAAPPPAVPGIVDLASLTPGSTSVAMKQTSTLVRELYPEWHQEFELRVPLPNAQRVGDIQAWAQDVYIVFDVFDAITHMPHPHAEWIGSAQVPLLLALKHAATPVHLSLGLSTDAGVYDPDQASYSYPVHTASPPVRPRSRVGGPSRALSPSLEQYDSFYGGGRSPKGGRQAKAERESSPQLDQDGAMALEVALAAAREEAASGTEPVIPRLVVSLQSKDEVGGGHGRPGLSVAHRFVPWDVLGLSSFASRIEEDLKAGLEVSSEPVPDGSRQAFTRKAHLDSMLANLDSKAGSPKGGGASSASSSRRKSASLWDMYLHLLNELCSKFPRREFQLLGVDEYNRFRFLPSFLRPLNKAAAGLSQSQLARMVADMPVDTFPHDIPIGLPSPPRAHTLSPAVVLSRKRGSELELALLLASLFLGLGLDAYLAVGTRASGILGYWVVTRTPLHSKTGRSGRRRRRRKRRSNRVRSSSVKDRGERSLSSVGRKHKRRVGRRVSRAKKSSEQSTLESSLANVRVSGTSVSPSASPSISPAGSRTGSRTGSPGVSPPPPPSGSRGPRMLGDEIANMERRGRAGRRKSIVDGSGVEVPLLDANAGALSARRRSSVDAAAMREAVEAAAARGAPRWGRRRSNPDLLASLTPQMNASSGLLMLPQPAGLTSRALETAVAAAGAGGESGRRSLAAVAVALRAQAAAAADEEADVEAEEDEWSYSYYSEGEMDEVIATASREDTGSRSRGRSLSQNGGGGGGGGGNGGGGGGEADLSQTMIRSNSMSFRGGISVLSSDMSFREGAVGGGGGGVGRYSTMARIHNPLLTFEAEKFAHARGPGEEDAVAIVHWDPVTGRAFSDPSESGFPFRRLGNVVNHHNGWVNVGYQDAIERLVWNLEDSVRWRVFLEPQDVESFGRFECWYSHPQSMMVTPVLDRTEERRVGRALEAHLCSLISGIRSDARFDERVSEVLRSTLAYVDMVKLRGGERGVRAAMHKAWPQVQRAVPDGHFLHARLFCFRNASLESIIAQLGFTGLLSPTGSSVVFVSGVRLVSLPLSVEHTWVWFGYVEAP